MGFIAFMVVMFIIWVCCGGLKSTGIFDKPYQSHEEMVRDCSKDMKNYAPKMYDLKIKQAREWDKQNKSGK